MLNRIKNIIYSWLRRSEKITGVDNVYYAKGGFWMTLGYGVNIIKGLAISILMANLLSRDSYGYYKYILSLFSVVSIFSLGGLSTAVTQAVARDYDGVFKKAIKTVLRWSWLGSLCLLFFALYYYQKNNLIFTWSFIILAIAFPWYSISGYYGEILSGKKKFDVQTKYYSLYSLLSSITILLAVIFTKNVFWIIFAFAVSDAIIGGFLTWYSSKKYLRNDKVDPESMKYGVNLSLIGVISIVAQNIDKIILPIFLGYQELAVYAIALVAPEQIKALLKNIGPLTLPKFAKTEINEEVKNKIISSIFKAMIPVGAIIGLYYFIAPWLYRLVYPLYPDAIQYSRIFSLSLIVAPTILITSFFQAHKQTKLILTDNIFNSITQILLVLVFVYLWGLWGLIFARMISRLITLFFEISLLKKATPSQ